MDVWKLILTKEMQSHQVPGEPKTLILGGYDPYIEGLKPSFFMGFGVQRWFVSPFDA